MGVYIKGMKMPASCYDCNCFIRDSDGSDYCCLLMIDIENNNKRDDDCPLIPVPPHGDLIDRDALCEGRVSNDNVSICAKAAPVIIPAEEGGI